MGEVNIPKKRHHDDFYYAVEIIIGISILWTISLLTKEQQFMSWGIASFLGTLERDIRYRKILLKQRFIHTIFATLITTIFLILCGPGYLSFVLSLFFSMLFGNLFSKYPAGWKIMPITSGVLNYLAISLSQTSQTIPVFLIVLRTVETIFGAFLAIVIQFSYMKFFRKDH